MLKYLRNMKSRPELEAALAQESFHRVPASFYRYRPIQNPQQFRDMLYTVWFPLRIFGRVYVAKEGINAQISLPEYAWTSFLDTLEAFEELSGMFVNRSSDSGDDAFVKLDVKVREKIVADGIAEPIFEVSSAGTHLEPQAFHQKISQENVVVVDTRNHYECETGKFQNAMVPQSQTFRDVLPELAEKLKDKKDKEIVMYCTGGIRCEKASAYFKSKGFDKVSQLKGGVINYLNEMKGTAESKFDGSLFVFDGRMAEPTVNEKISKCQDCREPYDVHSDCANKSCHQLMIQCPSCALENKGCCSPQCLEVLSLPIEKQAS